MSIQELHANPSESKGPRDTSESARPGNVTLAELTPEQTKVSTHVGRFKKVTRDKCVKGYSAKDLAAILGANGADEVFPSPL